MNRSHHKGHYEVRNGSDKEPGGVRRGPKRKPKKEKPGLLRRALDEAKKIVWDALKDAAKNAAKKEFKKRKGAFLRKRAGKTSHHKGEYPIANGSDKEPGGVRRGPKRRPCSNEPLAEKRARWREEWAARRAR